MAHEVIDDIIGRECGEEITTMTGCMCAIEDIIEIVGTIMNCAQNGGTCKYQKISAGTTRILRRELSQWKWPLTVHNVFSDHERRVRKRLSA